jgi:hypothetical protein
LYLEICAPGELVDLRMIKPGIKGQAEAAKDSKSLAETVASQQAGRRAVSRIAHGFVRVPGRDMANAAKAVAAGANMGRQYRFDPVAQAQIRVADNSGADFGLTVDPTCAHSRDAIDELGLAYGPHFHGPGLTVHGAGLHEHGCEDIVSTADIEEQIIEQITPTWSIPQVMVRIDDRQIGLENRLFAPVEPSLADWKII